MTRYVVKIFLSFFENTKISVKPEEWKYQWAAMDSCGLIVDTAESNTQTQDMELDILALLFFTDVFFGWCVHDVLALLSRLQLL